MNPEQSERDHRLSVFVLNRTGAASPTNRDLVSRGLRELADIEVDSEVSNLVEVIRRSNSWDERSDAWCKVRTIGPARRGWESHLKGLICENDGWSRIFAAEALAKHNCAPDEAIPVLIAMLESSLELGNVSWARVAIGSIGRYQRPSQEQVDAALPQLLGALDSDDDNVVGYAAQTLSQWGRAALAAIPKIAVLTRRPIPSWLRSFLEEVLGNFDPSIHGSVESLCFALTSDDPTVRAKAVCEIANFGTEASTAVPYLLMLLNDDSSDVRRFLAFALGRIGGACERVVGALSVLTQDSDPTVRIGAAYATLQLGIGKGTSFDELVSGTRSTHGFVRYLSAWALGDVGRFDLRRAVDALIQADGIEGDHRIKAEIRKSLQKLKDNGAGDTEPITTPT